MYDIGFNGIYVYCEKLSSVLGFCRVMPFKFTKLFTFKPKRIPFPNYPSLMNIVSYFSSTCK